MTVSLTLDANDTKKLLAFWAAILGYDEDDGTLVDPAGKGPSLWVQEVPEKKAAKNRLHLDLGYPASEYQEKYEAALKAGATEVAKFDTWYVLADPEGNEFCISNAG